MRSHPGDRDVHNATFSTSGLDGLCQLDRLGPSVTGRQIHDDHAVPPCQVLEPDDWCHQCSCQGVPRDTVVRRLAQVPPGRPTILEVLRAVQLRPVCCRRW